MSDETKQPSGRSFWLSVVGVIGCFLIFAFVLYVSYLPRRDSSTVTPVFSAAEMSEVDKLAPADRETRLREMRTERGIPTPEDRKERLDTMQAREAVALTTYQWIDKEKGIVELPIDRAVELTVKELQAARAYR